MDWEALNSTDDRHTDLYLQMLCNTSNLCDREGTAGSQRQLMQTRGEPGNPTQTCPGPAIVLPTW